jgi:hypothetical protein
MTVNAATDTEDDWTAINEYKSTPVGGPHSQFFPARPRGGFAIIDNPFVFLAAFGGGGGPPSHPSPFAGGGCGRHPTPA